MKRVNTTDVNICASKESNKTHIDVIPGWGYSTTIFTISNVEFIVNAFKIRVCSDFPTEKLNSNVKIQVVDQKKNGKRYFYISYAGLATDVNTVNLINHISQVYEQYLLEKLGKKYAWNKIYVHEVTSESGVKFAVPSDGFTANEAFELLKPKKGEGRTYDANGKEVTKPVVVDDLPF